MRAVLLVAALFLAGCFQPDCDDGPWRLYWHSEGAWDGFRAAGLPEYPSPPRPLPWNSNGETHLESSWGIEEAPALRYLAWIDEQTLDPGDKKTGPYIVVWNSSSGIIMEGRMLEGTDDAVVRDAALEMLDALVDNRQARERLADDFVASRGYEDANWVRADVHNPTNHEYFGISDVPLTGLDSLVASIQPGDYLQTLNGVLALIVHVDHLEFHFMLPYVRATHDGSRLTVTPLDYVSFTSHNTTRQQARASAEAAWAAWGYEPNGWESQAMEDIECTPFWREVSP